MLPNSVNGPRNSANMPRAEEIFKIEAFILRHTEAAIQIKHDGEKIWLPKSQLYDVEDLPQEGDAEIKMKAWIAKEKGLI